MWVWLAILLLGTWWVMKKADGGALALVICGTSMLIWSGTLLVVHGPEAMASFMVGSGMEFALSLDNLMAFGLVFAYFRLPKECQGLVLSVGIWSAAFFRLVFTLIGVATLQAWGGAFEVILGMVVILTAIKVAVGGNDAKVVNHESRWYYRSLRRWLPVSHDATEPVFFKNLFVFNPHEPSAPVLRRYATPLLACLVSIEATDIVFSMDSVPAVIITSRAPLIIYSAMIFSIIALRSMYGLIDELKDRLEYLPVAIVGVLGFTGACMVFEGAFNRDISQWFKITVIAAMLWAGAYDWNRHKRGAQT